MGERPSVKPWMRPQSELKANPRPKAYLHHNMPVETCRCKGWRPCRSSSNKCEDKPQQKLVFTSTTKRAILKTPSSVNGPRLRLAWLKSRHPEGQVQGQIFQKPWSPTYRVSGNIPHVMEKKEQPGCGGVDGHA